MALRVAYYRQLRGLTQQRLAKILGIHPTSLSKIERGHRYLTESMERRLVVALALTPDERRDMLGLPRSGRVAHPRLLGSEQ